jgi:hypothetical protein
MRSRNHKEPYSGVIESEVLKGQCHDFFYPRFFHQNIRPGSLIKGLKPFRIYFRIREDNRIFKNACGVIDTACTILRSKIDHISANSKQNSKRL